MRGHGSRQLPSETIIRRIEASSIPEPNSGCMLWLGAINSSGYGQLWNGSRPEQVHRLIYKAQVGEIRSGEEIDHLCRVRCCVNPKHLECVSHRENMRRSNSVMGANSRKTHCKRGHVLAGRNLSITKSGSRQCRTCIAMHARNKRARRRAKNV